MSRDWAEDVKSLIKTGGAVAVSVTVALLAYRTALIGFIAFVGIQVFESVANVLATLAADVIALDATRLEMLAPALVSSIIGGSFILALVVVAVAGVIAKRGEK